MEGAQVEEDPHDRDPVILLPLHGTQQLVQEHSPARELAAMWLTRRAEALFAVADATAWEAWVAVLRQTRAPDRRCRGRVKRRR